VPEPISPSAGGTPDDAFWIAEVGDHWREVYSSWDSWTPTWSCSVNPPSLGNGTLTGSYHQVGKTVDFRMRFVAGSTTTFGEGLWGFTMPTGAPPAVHQTCSAMAISAASARYVLAAYLTASAGIFRLTYSGTSGVRTNSGATDVPFEWAQNASLLVTGVYETS
jgi:hypothetical protein